MAASVALWVLFTTSMREGSPELDLSLLYLCLVVLTSAVGGVLRFFLPPSGTEPSCIGSMLLGFAIGVPVLLTVLGRLGLFTQAPNAGVTAVLVFMTAFLCFSLAATLGIATFLANFFPLRATS